MMFPKVCRAANFSLFVITTLASPSTVIGQDWPSWRGPSGTGRVAESTAPSTWSAEENVRWKVPLPGPGNSSPIEHGGRVWVTQFDKATSERQLRCYSSKTGDELWVRSVKSSASEPTHPTNPYCAASPVTDGKNVVAFFGDAGLCCFSVEGEMLWQRQLGSLQHLFGQGASPLIHGDLVTMNFGPGLEQFWITLNLRTGEEVWKLTIDKVDAPSPFDQPDGPKLPPGTKLRDPFGTWATPLLVTTEKRNELVLAFPNELRAVNPTTGETLWTCDKLGNQILASPILVGDQIVCLGSTAMAVETGGEGDVTASHRKWFEEEDRPRIGTGVGFERFVIANTMQGVVECLSLDSGDRMWQKRLAGSSSGGGSWSSLVAAGQRIFATNKDGSVFVFKANPEYELVATNRLHEKTNATPALGADHILIRTDKHLWCIGS